VDPVLLKQVLDKLPLCRHLKLRFQSPSKYVAPQVYIVLVNYVQKINPRIEVFDCQSLLDDEWIEPMRELVELSLPCGSRYCRIHLGPLSVDVSTKTELLSSILSNMRFILVLSCLFYWTQAQDKATFVSLEQVEGNYGQVTDIQQGPSDVLWICSKDGRIRTTNGDTILDISDRVRNAGERGLLGLALDPDFATNGYYYVNYSHDTGNHVTRISQFDAEGTEVIIAEIDQPFSNHNGGQLQFHSDGYLYIATGDGGLANDVGNRAARLDNLLGKILRVDVSNINSDSALPRYTIPPDNPLVGQSNVRPEIYHWGLRNPWRFSFDGNEMWIADVGQGAREEVNRVTGMGLDFGWRPCEGTRTHFAGERQCDCTDSCYVTPVLEYGRSQGRSVTGGYVYRGPDERLTGTYLYGDYESNALWGAREENGVWTRVIDESLAEVSTFGIDTAGEVYVGTLSGQVYRIVASDEPGTENMCRNPGLLNIGCKDHQHDTGGRRS